jgi:hypothetical protein
MAFRRSILLFIAIAGVLFPAKAQAGDIESQVMAKINASRGSALAVHSGLLYAARSHSQEMASHGGLDHNGADERVNSAAPDPAEGNGAPDDGFPVASWCENVTYVNYGSEADAASNIYKQWRKSGAHNACMTNSNKNVGAVGIYWDGQTWWATFIAEVDRTPPGGARSSGPQTQDVTDPSKPTKVTPEQPSGVNAPKATPAPAAPVTQNYEQYTPSYGSAEAVETASPSPSPTPQPQRRVSAPSGVLAPARTKPTTSDLPGLGMQEIAGLIAALVFGGLLLERRLTPDDGPAGMVDDDELFRPSVRLERAGHP